ncbi:peptidase S8 family protein [Caenibius tardaugens NBRC 16725]|uniref:Peptidase S8 family protein n=1 Tax=Caenibius tardaugens NBRC 16725 TaxID=1219035 RepID=U2YB25_9SPHN|nr:peptidase S8 family protein [Caenibius tardaugens NBRC 16725]
MAVPTAFDTTEFQASTSAKFHNAVAAWSDPTDPATGSGVAIAIIDDGIDTNNAEFTGRISNLSKDFAGHADFASQGGTHGTRIALVAAAARNDVGTMGIAYDATIMALRVDRGTTCSSRCRYDTAAIVQAISYAADNGARVINLSMSGSSASAEVTAAITAATADGVVVVVSAGNDGLANPSGFARDLLVAGGGNVIVVGSVDANGNISTWSNRAGSTKASYLAALGQDVPVTALSGSGIATYSGTSFSAPQVSGAVALLAQAFPALSGAQIVEILLDTAHDAGAVGTDAVYGRGILDIAAAMNPVGPTSFAGTDNSVILGNTIGAGSEAMGDALTGASLGTVVLDKYNRAYGFDMGHNLRSASIVPKLRNALASEQRVLAGASDKATFAFTVDATNSGNIQIWPDAMRLTQEDAEKARVLAARVALRLSPNTQVGFGFSDTANGLVAQLQGADRPAFFVAQDAASEEGFMADDRVSLALRRQIGGWGLTAGAESARVVSGAPLRFDTALRDSRSRDGMTRFGIALDRDWGPVDMAFGLSWMNENRTVLGARFNDAFGGKGADSVVLDGRLGWDFAPSWRFGAAWREGWTMARSAGLIADGSQLRSRAWSFDVSKRQVFGQSDSIALRIAQPLRVESGRLRLDLPVAYDYATGTTTFGTRSLNLAPDGREVMGELAWNGRLFSGFATASVFYRRDPGHYAQVPDDKGIALRWSKGF